jgi:hypothetical protein
MKWILFVSMLLISISLYSVDYSYKHNANDVRDVSDIDNVKMSDVAGKDTVYLDFGAHNPVNTYNPAIKFNTRFVLTDFLKLAVIGNFFNEGTLKDINDASTDTVYNEQNWNAMKNYAEAIIGWKMNDDIHLGFMLGGGVNIDNYFKQVDIANSITTEKKDGYGFISTGVGLKLNSGMFKNSLNYFFLDQYLQVQIIGNGSVGAESFSFETPSKDFGDPSKNSADVDFLATIMNPIDKNVNPSFEHDAANNAQDNFFRYTGFRSYGAFGFSIPFNKLISIFSRFDDFEFNVGMEHSVALRFYNIYENFNTLTSAVDKYTIKAHFEPSGFALNLGVIFRPINEIQIAVNYKPQFTFGGSEWELNGYLYKDYIYSVEHEVSGIAKFKFPKVVTLSIGTIYHVVQRIEYQYTDEGGKVRSSIGGGGLTHDVLHIIQPVFELGFDIIEKNNAVARLLFGWNPNIILYDADRREYRIATSGTGILDANVLNLANWKMNVEIEFDPKAL